MTAGNVMDDAAVLMNDAAKSVFTYAVQIPYLNIALHELQEQFELNNVPLSNAASSAITVLAGATTATLPAGVIEIQELYERDKGTTNDFVPMIRKDFLPKTEVLTSSLIYWSYNGQALQFLGATQDKEIKIDYVTSFITDVTTSGDTIGVINSRTFLGYRTAALLAQFIYAEDDRAGNLNQMAIIALDTCLSINVKGSQSISTRRQPFRAGWKNRTQVY